MFNIYPEQQKSLPLLCKIYKKKKRWIILLHFNKFSRMQGFVLKWHGHNFGQMFTMHWKVIANSQPEFECQPLSYKQDTDFLVL